MSEAAAPRAPHPVLVRLGRVLEAVLNRLVDLDPETRGRLAALDGRALTLDPGAGVPALRIAVDRERLRVGPGFAGESALRIGASLGSLLGMALARGREGSVAPGTVQIAGDAELARQLERIATRFAPDFDEAFARVFGDVAGFQIARALRRAFAWSRDSARAFAHDAAEFLTEESRDLVARAELEQFLDEVDALRERADRLDARVRRVEARGGAPRT